jgi:uncharacterized membrane protein
VITQKFSRLVGWLLAIAALLLSGFGIYVGRFLRWNSWDTLTNPRGLVLDAGHQVIHPLSYPRALGVTVVYGVGLLLGYIALHFWHPPTAAPVPRGPSSAPLL